MFRLISRCVHSGRFPGAYTQVNFLVHIYSGRFPGAYIQVDSLLTMLYTGSSSVLGTNHDLDCHSKR